MRLRLGEPLDFGLEDVILHNGDVVFVDAAPVDTFYTAGLLPSAEHILPRDYDLDVIEAVARARGPMVNGASAAATCPGISSRWAWATPVPSCCRSCGELRRGSKWTSSSICTRRWSDPRERIRVLPGDVLILQEMPGQAIARFFATSFNFSGIFRIFSNLDFMSFSTRTTPN